MPLPIVRLPRRLARRRNQSGAAGVEFALVAPIFFLLFFSVADFSLMMFANLTMQNAVRTGARYAVTGQNNMDPNTSQPQRNAAIQAVIQNSSMGIYSMANASISTWVNKVSQTSGSSGMYGSAGDIVIIQVDCSWPLLTPMVAAFFPDAHYHFSVAATMRNEAF